MPEHTPKPVIVALMRLFFWGMAVFALVFWLGSAVSTRGVSGFIGVIGPGAVALFAALHIPAAVAGILLWQWTRHSLSKQTRVMLEAATLYFIAAIAVGMFLNYLVMSMI